MSGEKSGAFKVNFKLDKSCPELFHALIEITPAHRSERLRTLSFIGLQFLKVGLTDRKYGEGKKSMPIANDVFTIQCKIGPQHKELYEELKKLSHYHRAERLRHLATSGLLLTKVEVISCKVVDEDQTQVDKERDKAKVRGSMSGLLGVEQKKAN